MSITPYEGAVLEIPKELPEPPTGEWQCEYELSMDQVDKEDPNVAAGRFRYICKRCGHIKWAASEEGVGTPLHTCIKLFKVLDADVSGELKAVLVLRNPADPNVSHIELQEKLAFIYVDEVQSLLGKDTEKFLVRTRMPSTTIITCRIDKVAVLA